MTDDKSGWQRMVGRFRQLFEADETPASSPETEIEPEPRVAEVEYTAVELKWQRAMPICLSPFFGPMIRDLDTLDFMSIRLALLEEYPSPADQALALFGWYGQGTGSWTTGEYPAYETVPEQLLMELPLTALVAALQDNPLDPSHLQGAARFLSGDLFLGMRGGEAAQLPPDVVVALQEQVQVGGDEAQLVQINQLQAKQP